MKTIEKTDNNKTIDINLQTIYNIAGNLETLIHRRGGWKNERSQLFKVI